MTANMNDSRIESLIELASVLAKQNDYQETLRLVAENASSLMKAETTLIMMINPRTRETVKTLYKEVEQAEDEPYRFVHAYLSGWAIANNSGFLTENITEDSRFNKELFKDINLQSVMCVPFTVEGVVIGTLLVLNKFEKYIFSESDFSFLEKFNAIVAPYLRDIQKIQQYFTTPLPQDTLLQKYEAHGLLGKSKKFIQLLQTIESAARCDVRVLLDGQSGTGKELIAKAIHHYSSRNSQNFVAIDCGAIPANLIESELFGHVKGTFFMDEINNLPMELQTKLLRFLQENEIRPVGGNETIKVECG